MRVRLEEAGCQQVEVQLANDLDRFDAQIHHIAAVEPGSTPDLQRDREPSSGNGIDRGDGIEVRRIAKRWCQGDVRVEQQGHRGVASLARESDRREGFLVERHEDVECPLAEAGGTFVRKT